MAVYAVVVAGLFVPTPGRAPLQINNQFNWLLQSMVTNWFYLLGQRNGAIPDGGWLPRCLPGCLFVAKPTSIARPLYGLPIEHLG